MEVTLKIPPDLQKDIEYIPKQTLPEVLVTLIQEGINNRVVTEEPEEVGNEFGLEMITTLISKLEATGTLGKSGCFEGELQEKPVVLEESSVDMNISKVIIEDIEDDESLDDFMDLMK